MAATIVVTGNHYIVDGMAGGALALLGLALGGLHERLGGDGRMAFKAPRSTKTASRTTASAILGRATGVGACIGMRAPVALLSLRLSPTTRAGAMETDSELVCR